MTRQAYVGVRDQPSYRRDAFATGLEHSGYRVSFSEPKAVDRDTVYCCWNRYGHYHVNCTQVEAAGGKVLIAENGYLGRDQDDRQYYALALSGHNGSGDWKPAGPERFVAMGVNLKPWQSGTKIVVRGQRGIGSPSMASPHEWHKQIEAQLREVTDRPIQVIPHPGSSAERDRSHEDYLQGAHALVTWSSSVGVKALAMGVPVFYCAPHWICEGAAKPGIAEIESPLRDDGLRLRAFERMAWAQWSVTEIARGEPFRHLLQ